MLIQKAAKCDLEEILDLQKRAFYSEAEAYHDFTIAPLTQTIESLEEDYRTKTMLKAVVDSQIIGSVRAYEKEKTCYIERLIVSPDFQNKGIGSELLKFIENEFGACTRFELFTGKHSMRNIRFYQKHGYVIFKEEPINDRITFVFMEKHSPRG